MWGGELSAFTLIRRRMRLIRKHSAAYCPKCSGSNHIKYTGKDWNVHPCVAESLISIFQSFEAGIANAISSIKWMKNVTFYVKKTLQDVIIWFVEHLSHDVLWISVVQLVWYFIETVYIGPSSARGNSNLFIIDLLVFRKLLRATWCGLCGYRSVKINSLNAKHD